ncbi:class I SAM-dependent methyltransferase [Arthrobacter sp. H20]|uniref:class I SAM-dependent methyltransferase n=1 Tax=Arthrobacter sp. H20 TaxID=1267981 RepID=UPI00047EA2D1|nr:class I SAM-dependent methyltransferase [Arthrobacter sp. H20]
MGFNVAADAYDRFMGRYSEPLASEFARLAGVRRGHRALDVGCGPGALTARLVEILGPDHVAAVDPSPQFVRAARSRLSNVDVRSGEAEGLPFPDDCFDVTLAQLVVHFMKDPVKGLRQMGRVTRNGGVVAACVWDHSGGRGPLSVFWQAAHQMDPLAPAEGHLAGAREGRLTELFKVAGLRDCEQDQMTVRVEFESFTDWWEPFTLGVGPAGDYVGQLDTKGRRRLRAACADLLPVDLFSIEATAWAVVGSA